ncbi:TPA: transposase [Pseudomonas aeruginosa]|nr:transposase [Pseudomonas aeruginosa]
MTRRRFPESCKREAVDQVLAGTLLRHLAEILGIAESLLSKWKRQYEQQETMPFRATASSGARARSRVAYASNWLRSPWERDVLKNRLPGAPRPIGVETHPLLQNVKLFSMSQPVMTISDWGEPDSHIEQVKWLFKCAPKSAPMA